MKRTLSLLTLSLVAAAGVGCDAHDARRGPMVDMEMLVVERHALVADGSPIEPVGVAVDPDSGVRFVLGASNRLYDVTVDGTATLNRDLAADSWIGELPLQDLCATSATELYTIAPDNGIRLNLETGWVDEHFCIVPPMEEFDEGFDPNDPDPWVDLRQETHAIACDVDRALLFAQPQTLPRWDEDPQPVRSEVSLYDLPSGADLEWHGLPSEMYLAGGMAVVNETTVILGRDSRLNVFDLTRGVLEPLVDLTDVGITSIEGLAPDGTLGHLLVVDGDDQELVTLSLDALGLQN